jgi:hypothetical protein
MLNTTHNLHHEPDYRTLRRSRTAMLIVYALFLAASIVSCVRHIERSLDAAAVRVERASR